MRPSPVTTAPPDATERAISRTEWLWLLGAVLFGAILRLSFPGRMAVEHFDEGVYASNFWFEVEQGGEYPARHLYAPPLLPMAIEWTMIVASLCGIKPTGFIPMIPSLMAGLATIPSMWWVGRRWFGPSAGIVSAWLVSASDFHACYSRAALTDVPVCLFMLWGVYFLWLALQTGTRRDILLAGLFTGLAWWTKYNGWLPLAIGLSGGAAWQLSLPRAERRLHPFGTRWLLVAVTAFAIWSPVLIDLQRHGGYAAVSANHSQYFMHFTDWGDTASKQLWHIGIYDNWLGVFYEPFSLIRLRQVRMRQSGSPVNEDHTINLSTGQTFVLEDLSAWLGQIATLATPFLLLVATTAACIWSLRYDHRSRANLSVWFLAAWVGGLTLATPLYYPYPRLVIPWLMASWFGVGFALRLWLQRSGTPANIADIARTPWKPSRFEWIVIGWLVTCGCVRSGMGTAHVWHDRTGVQIAAAGFANKIRASTQTAGFVSDEAIVYVCGQPAMFFGLKASGLPLVGPIQDPVFPSRIQPRPTFLVARRPDSERWKTSREDLMPDYLSNALVSHLVRLDDGLGTPWRLHYYSPQTSVRFGLTRQSP